MAKQITETGLVRLLEERTDHGRICVPVLGSGLNLQAAAVAGAANRDDWQGLLRKVGAEIEISPQAFDQLPRSNLAKWETMLRRCAVVRDIEAYAAEHALQKLVCAELRAQERASCGYALYGEFVAAGFQDAISLNFDRRLALHSGTEIFLSAPGHGRVRAADEPVYRHSLIRHDGGESRIWYPHGDTRKTSTLKFGVRKYGQYIASLERQRNYLMANWRRESDPAAEQRLPPADFDKQVRWGGARREWVTWPTVFLVAPLVFIGCSLAFDEWPLWWLLHQRARILAAFPHHRHPPTVYACAGEVPENLLGHPCEIQICRFTTFPSLWAAVRRALKT